MSSLFSLHYYYHLLHAWSGTQHIASFWLCAPPGGGGSPGREGPARPGWRGARGCDELGNVLCCSRPQPRTTTPGAISSGVLLLITLSLIFSVLPNRELNKMSRVGRRRKLPNSFYYIRTSTIYTVDYSNYKSQILFSGDFPLN